MTTTRRRTTTRKTRRRRKKPRRRTYVVEYDVDNLDKKFSIKTTRKVIRRRRKTKRKYGSRRGRCSGRRSGNRNEENEASSTVITRRSLTRSIEANYPKLHVFGNKNALEYFPDDDSENGEDLDMFGSGPALSEGGAGTLVMAASRYAIGGTRGLLKRKQMGAVRRAPIATVTSGGANTSDLLSNIMDTMDRWHSMTKPSNVEKIKIDTNGKLSMENERKDKTPPTRSTPVTVPNTSEILNAPRGGAANNRNVPAETFQNNNGGSAGGGDARGDNRSNSTNNDTTESGGTNTQLGTSGTNNNGNNLPQDGSSGGDNNGIDDTPASRILTRRKSALTETNDSNSGGSNPRDGAGNATPGRISGRRKSTLAPPPSLDGFPALSSTSSSEGQGQSTPSRILTRRRSSLVPPPSIDDFPALGLDGGGIDSRAGNYQTSRIQTRRRSSLAPPPSIDEFPALGLSDIPEGSSLDELPPRRVSARRKSTLAPPPSIDEFPALACPSSGLSSIQESDQSTPGRLTRRRRSTLAPPPSLNEFPALACPSPGLPSIQESDPSTPGRLTRRRKSTLAPPPSLLDFPALANPEIDEIFGGEGRKFGKQKKKWGDNSTYQPLQPPPEFPDFDFVDRNQSNPTASQTAAPLVPPIYNFAGMSAVPAMPWLSPVVEPQPVPRPSIFPIAAAHVPQSPILQSASYSSVSTVLAQSSPLPPDLSTVAGSSMSQQTTNAESPIVTTPTAKPKKAKKDDNVSLIPPIPSKPEEPPQPATPIDLNHKPTKITWKNNPLKKKSIFNSDDEDHDFQYSAESLEVAIKTKAAKKQKCEKQKSITPIKSRKPDPVESMEKDEDLVQLDDDDDIINEQKESTDGIPKDSTDKSSKQTDTNEEADQTATAKNPKNILDLHDDSDWEELNDDKDEDGGNKRATRVDRDQGGTPITSSASKKASHGEILSDVDEAERSYTPCLDEQVHEANDKSGASTEGEDPDRVNPRDVGESAPRIGRNRDGFEGIETELISDEDNDELLRDENGAIKDGSRKSKKKKKSSKDENENAEEFRKVSKSTKERRYRDKRDWKERSKRSGRSRSRSQSRSKSRSKSISRSRSRQASRTRGSRSRASRSRSRSRSWSRNRRFNNGFNSRGRRNFRLQRGNNNNKRREIQRYNVRNVVFERNPRNKDKYGRDTSRPARSQSRSISPRQRRSISPRRRSPSQRSQRLQSRDRSVHRHRRASVVSNTSVRHSLTPPRHSARSPIRRSQSPRFAHYSRSPSRSAVANGVAIRSRTPSASPRHKSGKGRRKKKQIDKKSSTKRRTKRKKTRDGSAASDAVSHFDERSRGSPIRSRSKSWDDHRVARSWTRSLSPAPHHPNHANAPPIESWTPPIGQAGENVRLLMASREKKRRREKKKKLDKRRSEKKEKRRQRQPEPSRNHVVSNKPSKEVFASGDNILVSVSFNKDKDTGTQQQTTIVTLPPSKDQIQSKKQNERAKKSNKDPNRRRKKTTAKPVAIIDLDNSPFKEITPSPRAVIVLSDSDHERDANKKDNANQQRGGGPSVTSATESNQLNIEHGDLDESQVDNSAPASPSIDVESFELLSMGPKTPPEPTRLKFSMPVNAKNKIRNVVNPLHDTADDQNDDETLNDAEGAGTGQDATQNVQSQQSKVGPNTPPESGPYSPDVYDPFEPTKSPSPTPSLMNESVLHLEPPRSSEATANTDGVKRPDKSIKTIDLTKGTFNSKAAMDAAKMSLESDTIDKENNGDSSLVSPMKDKTSTDDVSKSSSSIHVFSNILITPAKENIVRTQPQRSLNLFPVPLSISPAKANHSLTPKKSPMKFGSSLVSRLPMPPPTKMVKPSRHNGNDDIEGESPYSPGSSDYDDLFEPPPLSPSGKKMSGGRAGTSKGARGETFDDLFGSTSPTHANKLLKTSVKPKRRHKKSSIKGELHIHMHYTLLLRTYIMKLLEILCFYLINLKTNSFAFLEWLAVNKQSTQMGYGKLNDDQIRILEDLPASAVELQAKDKVKHFI